MISFAIAAYFILLVTMFFVEVPNYLPIIIGLGVFFYISFYYFKNEGGKVQKYYTLKTFLLSALISIIIVLSLGVVQSLTIGYDPSEVLDPKVFKLYVTLCIFVIYTLIARIKYVKDL
ncbi:hypothetical protein [Anaerococcus degeneri]|uniref:Uncharacterized protein n=1 Tax=Anaerococcus degeneri TaxID=361500 RepID=A0ABS7YUM2_9FIRM|nr:hypothetical protein [Anaerococcus degeneri]MBP2015163.1 asparagine N-glycosylation enzyme membrane subunit Stt3 [Anaerococcus degeneri]MCA2095422.1 hypothetical protein [Anaerococcus degeneri]